MAQTEGRHAEHQAEIYHPRFLSLFAELDSSRDPRGPDHLHEVIRPFLSPGCRVLDAGCRDAAHLVRLLQTAVGSTGVGVDPVPWHLARARAAVAEAGLDSRVELVEGVIEDLPHQAGEFDVIWCRDVLEVVADLSGVLSTLARLLSPTGCLLVYTVLATELLEPAEAARLHHGLGNVPANAVRATVETAFAEAGLVVERAESIGTEWREHDEERHQPASQAMLRLARLRHDRARVVATYGQQAYDTAEASLHWLPYLLLGKLEPVLYLLRHP